MTSIDRRSLIKALLAATSAASFAENATANETAAGLKIAADQDRFGKIRAIGFNTTTFKVAADDTQSALFMMEQHSTKPGGPPLHLHHAQDEFWYVLSGKYSFQIGSERYDAKSGDCLLGPRNLPHAYASLGPESGRLLVGFTPAGRMQEYFERPRTPGVYVADAALYREYGMELLGPPLLTK
ncbi:MAG TPA: cupin domain-containing protein [Terriglobales bacterium]|nr:cupin domain-containing protein [Terriglobales bacterium]